ncbi:related to dimeric dihydrodiol dehydrogenase [Melanopsichium pennsylvanicum]|uniref:D-xylose 1-dehydrogenase (NADP(+), D-xylono-1,5-lactone-forming) n=2 Tax=Melanopsichium pennsylvanicum TaxID=63383 RepID=A0AAJ4XR38_9BASI|nr:related to dimeric dihydrodiol dehydrogenase [Melanopsichium pennsylvanicum 4]SNX86842.1 related to dimeric dihydrodiol dehydrogenase [Melanopsichium pennsylvanicum]
MASVTTCKWGILATGGIAVTFSKDLLLDPTSRGVKDVKHTIVAAASSTSVTRAQEFLKQVSAPRDAKAYGSYTELVQDPNIDIIYVATPHSHHYENTLLALEAGKHVLCEKAFTINAAQAKHLFQVAKEKNLFLMEAVWVRFFPIVYEIQNRIHQKRSLGDIKRVFSDFGMPFQPDPNHRLFNPQLGGGALLDLGIYALTWQMLTLYEDPCNHYEKPEITSGMIKSKLTGVDEFTTVILNFVSMGAQGIATTNMSIQSFEKYVVLVQGTKADLTVPWPPYRPESFTIHQKDSNGKYTGEKEQVSFDIPGHGMFWEADACARALQKRNLEEQRVSWNYSILLMEIMDKVRYDNNFTYPDHLEATRNHA